MGTPIPESPANPMLVTATRPRPRENASIRAASAKFRSSELSSASKDGGTLCASPPNAHAARDLPRKRRGPQVNDTHSHSDADLRFSGFETKNNRHRSPRRYSTQPHP